MPTLGSAPMWRRPRSEKRACLAMKDGQGLSSYKTCSEKNTLNAVGQERSARTGNHPQCVIDTATRQQWTQTETGRRRAPIQHTIPAPPTGICRPLANGIGLPLAL